MLRLTAGLLVIGSIYVHSPHRGESSPSMDLSSVVPQGLAASLGASLARQAGSAEARLLVDSLSGGLAGSSGSGIAAAALRRTLSDTRSSDAQPSPAGHAKTHHQANTP